MPKRVPLPPEYSRRYFSVTDARQSGVGRQRLNGPDLARPFHGVRAVETIADAEADAEEKCRSYSPRLRPCSRIPGGAGRRRLLDALQLIRLGCASPMETRLRLLIVRAGLPEPQLNVDILDGRGDFVACGDLYFPEQRVLVEYDGDQHRTDTKMYERDQTRLANLRAIGVECIRVRQSGYVTHPERTVAEITHALKV
ncbi:DUF559 domain-containing protein [Subtercola frigoramans]|uniref:DUF559 domain-containing protein n=1 Tax=Subtercola frigoramans TaxID=120298 RepID=A0ABS2L8W8_9MICO|nr:DUF559 domain-containing protein [Subtercola frigoramans]MBM7473538.1 hypothetical protein [Subtercola frigoramans]